MSSIRCKFKFYRPRHIGRGDPMELKNEFYQKLTLPTNSVQI